MEIIKILIETFSKESYNKKLIVKLMYGIALNKYFLEILNIDGLVKKKKVLRANHNLYMTKVLRKTIMKRPELQANYIKSEAIENLKLYKIKRNFCSKLF